MVLKKVTEHKLVPKHEVVPKEKVQELLDKFGSEIDQFPQISRADPAVEAINAERGDVLKITRDSITAGSAVYYRVVV